MVGRTEVIWDSDKPHFVRAFDVDYFFEEQQMFLAEAYDMDEESKENDLSKQELIGSVEFSLHQVVSSRDQICKLELKDAKKGKPFIIITSEEKKKDGGMTAVMQLQGHFKKANEDIFFIIWKQISRGKFKPVFKSAAVTTANSLQNWKEAVLDTNLLCNGNND